MSEVKLRAHARDKEAPPGAAGATDSGFQREHLAGGAAVTAAVTAAGVQPAGAEVRPSENTKPSNPKDALGIMKLAFSVFPLPVLWEACLGMLEGGLKYGRHNYRVIGVRGSVYFDATFRHLSAWWEGEDLDPDSQLSHITKAITSLTVLRDAMIRDNWVDDRPPRSDPKVLAELNSKVKALLTKYPEPVAPYTELPQR